MSERDDLEPAMKRLSTSAIPLENAERVAERRARLVPALAAFADAEAERAHRRTRWRRLGAIAAVAAAVGGASLFFGLKNGTPAVTLAATAGSVRIMHDGVTSDGKSGLALTGADVLETLDGTAEVRLVSGAVVDLSAQSRVALATAERHAGAVTEHVHLAAGRVSVRVPKLPQGSKLTIGTPDATVTVHGTAFTVQVTKTPAGRTSTDVTVTQGRVAVDSAGRRIFLDPGSHWSSAGAPQAASTRPATPVTVPPTVEPAAASSAPVVAARRSTLRAENRLFRAAMAARRAHQPGKAIAIAQKLLQTYPDTPLAGEASALMEEARRDLATSAAP